MTKPLPFSELPRGASARGPTKTYLEYARLCIAWSEFLRVANATGRKARARFETNANLKLPSKGVK